MERKRRVGTGLLPSKILTQNADATVAKSPPTSVATRSFERSYLYPFHDVSVRVTIYLASESRPTKKRRIIESDDEAEVCEYTALY